MKKLLRVLHTSLFLFAFTMLIAGCSNEKVEVTKEEYTLSSDTVKSINIAVKDRDIDIIPTDSDDIKITYYKSDKEFYDIQLTDEKTLSMKSASNKEISDYFGMQNNDIKSITLEIPSFLQSDLIIETANNDITLPEMEITGQINININNGNILLENTLGKSAITLSTKNGDISGSLKGSYEDFEIHSKARKGKSNLPESKTDGNQRLDVSTNNGDIDILFK